LGALSSKLWLSAMDRQDLLPAQNGKNFSFGYGFLSLSSGSKQTTLTADPVVKTKPVADRC
jgi:hypothetical protein